ncbi:MAG: ArsR/SmtB family transcription factor [Gammaproteobacteria bacterium]
MSNSRVDFDQLSGRFKALSNPHRLMLFNRLMRCCEPGTRCRPDDAIRFCVGELGEGLEIAPSTLSHHLKELYRAGLIQMQRNGKNVECWLEPEVLSQIGRFFNTPD